MRSLFALLALLLAIAGLYVEGCVQKSKGLEKDVFYGRIEYKQIPITIISADKPSPDEKPQMIILNLDKKVPNSTGRLEMVIRDKTYKLYTAEYIPNEKQALPETNKIVVLFKPENLPPDLKSTTQFAKMFPLKANFCVYVRERRKMSKEEEQAKKLFEDLQKKGVVPPAPPPR